MRSFLTFPLLFGLCVAASAQTNQQSPASSSSSVSSPSQQQPAVHPGGLAEAGGASITLETNESLFDLATALNACGYDTDLAGSNPLRTAIRADVTGEVAASPAARSAQEAVCAYIASHQLNDKGREVAQYVSLALYVNPPPLLTPVAEETDMPPDALQVVNILPLLRTFVTDAHLHAIWLKHHAEYEAITAKLHDPVTQLVFGTNIYLKIPVSSYSDRRLLILVEPMLAPSEPNARIYSTDYVIVTSPNAAGAVRMDQIRHLYLHYTIEPLVYARSNSMLRLTPLLKPVDTAPIDFIYKTDVVALVTECMIKAIEARRMDIGLSIPQKPAGSKARADLAHYDEEMSTYNRQSEELRQKQVTHDMRQGWILTQYFYEQLILLERSPEGLDQRIGQMVYGMDVGSEQHRDEQIAFLPEGSGEFVRRAPRVPTGMMLAEKKMLEGDLPGAEAIADKALADPQQDHAQALFVKARVELMQHDPESSEASFQEVLQTAKDPRTMAWAHIYLGRLNDIKDPADRQGAVSEYKAALTVPGLPDDAKAAASKGLKTPFTVPSVKHEEEQPVDPSGKAEKQSYKPE